MCYTPRDDELSFPIYTDLLHPIQDLKSYYTTKIPCLLERHIVMK